MTRRLRDQYPGLRPFNLDTELREREQANARAWRKLQRWAFILGTWWVFIMGATGRVWGMAELKGPLAARRLVGGDTQQVHGLGELWGERPMRGWKWLHSSS